MRQMNLCDLPSLLLVVALVRVFSDSQTDKPASSESQADGAPDADEISFLQASLDFQQTSEQDRASAKFGGSGMDMAVQKPTTPEEITESNQDRTNCYPDGIYWYNDTLTVELPPSDGPDPRMEHVKLFYWFDRRGQERCLAAYIPPLAPKPMPVMLKLEGYDADLIFTGNVMFNSAQYHMASFLLGSPLRNATQQAFGAAKAHVARFVGSPVVHFEGGEWRFSGAVTDDSPQNCSDDNQDLEYFNTVLDFIQHAGDFDEGKVYVTGYSQNSMMAGFAGFCNSHRLAGISQSGSGIVQRGVYSLTPPGGCDFDGFYGKMPKNDPGKYFPVYPCHTRNSDLVHCSVSFAADVCMESDLLMHEYAVQEGYNALLAFVNGSTAKGTYHGWVDNLGDWTVGCFGIFERCSDECVSDMRTCIEERKDDFSGMILKTKQGEKYLIKDEGREILAFNKCLGGHGGTRVLSCAPSCSPTRAMLELTAPKGATFKWNVEAPQWDSPAQRMQRPSTSKCEHQAL